MIEQSSETAVKIGEEEKKEVAAAPEAPVCPACSEEQGQLISLNQSSVEQATFMDSFDQ